MNIFKLKGKAILSPMAGVTDAAFRILAKRYGAGLVYTELISSAALVRAINKTNYLIQTSEEEKPVGIQLFGNNAEEVVEAAKIVQDKFDFIDINCGCPAWSVIRTGSGSELLKNPEKIKIFVENLVKNVNIPITVKIRIGINDKNINAIKVAKLIEEAGASAIAVHGRTREQGYSGTANWDVISEVKSNVEIPVIGNGDVFTPEKFKECLDKSKVDGIMIARGAIGNPYIFKQISDFISTGKYSKLDNKKIFFEYLDLAKKFDINFNLIKGHAISFTKGIEKSTELRNELGKTKDIDEIIKIYDNIVNR